MIIYFLLVICFLLVNDHLDEICLGMIIYFLLVIYFLLDTSHNSSTGE